MMQPMYTLYLAGPVDGISADDANGWRREVAAEFPDVLFINPAAAMLNASKAQGWQVARLCQEMIKASDGLIANLQGPGRGFGTMREIQIARTHEKRVVIVPDGTMNVEETIFAFDVDAAPNPVKAVEQMLAWFADQIAAPRPFLIPFPFAPPEADE
jgi:nucleoside 2-deoxyribosyltransferase